MDPIKKGAIIAGSVTLGLQAVGTGVSAAGAKTLGTTLPKLLKDANSSVGKMLGRYAIALAVWAGIGAGIGAIVKAVGAKKGEKVEKEQD